MCLSQQNGGGNDKYIVLFVSFGWECCKGIDVIQKLSELLNDSYQLVVVGTVILQMRCSL